jgi:phytoene dehydrogenase-like protein
MAEPYDGIVLGTGHNSLVLQAYLCRCGLKVLSVDRAAVAGGGLATIENPRHPGFLHNTHSFFHRTLTAMPWYRDLELERHGARYVEPELNVALILQDGRSLQWWTDFEKTHESFAQFSQRDADALRRWRDLFQPIVRQILIPEARSPPLPVAKRMDLLSRSTLGRLLLDVSALSPLEFVEREFANDTVRAGLLFFNGLREVDLRQRGFGHSIPSLLASDHMAQMCVGGSARLAQALIEDIRDHGGEVRISAEPHSILFRSGKACGVELTSGERLESQWVASGLNPQQTFLQLVDATISTESLRQQAEQFQYNLLAPLFAVNLALAEPPRYAASKNNPAVDQAFMVILGLERFDQFHQIVRAHEAGQIPETVMWGACPTLFDPTQAPSNHHTAFMWEKLPYAVHGDAKNWDQIANGHAQKLLQLWTKYAPNLADSLIDVFSRSPFDTERSLPNMKHGDLLIGSFSNNQIGENRPFAGAGRYRTPFEGLYLCGGSTHPGGNITGLCGYNAARVIAADLDCPIWWHPPDAELALRSLT